MLNDPYDMRCPDPWCAHVTHTIATPDGFVDGVQSWTIRMACCGHPIGTRLDAGELDLGIVRDTPLNNPDNTLTIETPPDE